MSELFKDAVLDELAREWNVAQFVSFAPKRELPQRFARIHGYEPNEVFGSPESAVAALLGASPERSVNVRSFDPAQPKSSEFSYGLRSPEDVLAKLKEHALAGRYTIVNETVDVNDGGVSGVAFGDVLEFAPGDTPRSVEKPGTVSLPFELGMRLLETIYGFRPAVISDRGLRLEFSIHPVSRGVRHQHTILWEAERVAPIELHGNLTWPNRFSRLLGDKAFGLLIAHLLGLSVPQTTVVGRAVAPFRFGAPTGSREWWIRTCPVEPVPGRFTTRFGWSDPFKLLTEEDPEGTSIASILAQEGVEAMYSGAMVSNAEGGVIVEGVQGQGDDFMIGRSAPAPLPGRVQDAVLAVYETVSSALGPVRFEWVFDGKKTWIVQLHKGPTSSSPGTIYPGEPESYRRFDVTKGLEALRALIVDVQQGPEGGVGILLVGNVGITSHFGDVLRKARIPAKLQADGSTVAFSEVAVR